MNKQEKIDAIYKEIANKYLEFGCKVEYKGKGGKVHIGIITHTKSRYCDTLHKFYFTPYILKDKAEEKVLGTVIYEDITSRIGHPVLIGDVLDYHNYDCEGFLLTCGDWIELFSLWKNARKPIEEQSEECIDYIYSLIKTDENK